jgi:cell division septation protein DedD
MAVDGLKKRLVGGTALLIIGVVAWFWLLSADSPVDPVARETQIPPAPAIQPFAVPAPVAPDDVAPIGSERDSQPALRADPAVDKPVAIVPESHTATENSAAQPVKSSPQKNIKPVESKTANAAKPAETFELDQHGLPVAWVIQVGLFATQANADKIKTTLQQKGFKAYTEPFNAPSGSAGIKVLVGPKLSRERADAQKRAIDAALKMNTMVVRFQSA